MCLPHPAHSEVGHGILLYLKVMLSARDEEMALRVDAIGQKWAYRIKNMSLSAKSRRVLCDFYHPS